MPDEGAPARDFSCPKIDYRLLRGGGVVVFRCWNRRRCRTCAELMSWDDEDWIRIGIEYWLAQGVSLVFVTLTLADPLPYPQLAENWRVFKQAFARMVAKRPGSIGGIAFARVFERQEKRFERTGQTAVHLHALVAGVQYRGDRLGGRPRRRHFRKAEELGVTGAVVTKKELQELAVKYGVGPMLDITQVQASPDNPSSAYEVAKYLAKYLSKFEELAQWLPSGKQVIAGSQGKLSWAGPGVTRGSVRKERLERALARRQAGQGHPGTCTSPARTTRRLRRSLLSLSNWTFRFPGPRRSRGPLVREEEVHHNSVVVFRTGGSFYPS